MSKQSKHLRNIRSNISDQMLYFLFCFPHWRNHCQIWLKKQHPCVKNLKLEMWRRAVNPKFARKAHQDFSGCWSHARPSASNHLSRDADKWRRGHFSQTVTKSLWPTLLYHLRVVRRSHSCIWKLLEMSSTNFAPYVMWYNNDLLLHCCPGLWSVFQSRAINSFVQRTQ